MDRCPNEAAPNQDICAFHASLTGAWATASLRRPLVEELYARVHPFILRGQRIVQGERAVRGEIE